MLSLNLKNPNKYFLDFIVLKLLKFLSIFLKIVPLKHFIKLALKY